MVFVPPENLPKDINIIDLLCIETIRDTANHKLWGTFWWPSWICSWWGITLIISVWFYCIPQPWEPAQIHQNHCSIICRSQDIANQRIWGSILVAILDLQIMWTILGISKWFNCIPHPWKPGQRHQHHCSITYGQSFIAGQLFSNVVL